MKNIKITLVLVFCLFMSAAKAQFNGEFRLGIKASPSFTWLKTNDNQIEGNGSSVALDLGLTGEYFFAENYAIATGISVFLGQGGTLNYGIGGNFFPDSELSDSSYYNLPAGAEIKYSFDYIEIPISVKLRTNEIGYLRYFAQIPIFSLGFPIKGRADISGSGITNTEDENILKSVNPFSLTWGLGGGVEYSVSENTTLVGGLFYQNSIIDILENSGTQVTGGDEEDSKQVLNRLTIKIGILF